jgi:homogentisate 1,2-dioxygenase
MYCSITCCSTPLPLLPRTPHGPDSATFLKATAPEAGTKPVYLDSGLAFMFETTYLLKVSPHSLSCPERQIGYTECWEELPKMFTGEINPYH